ncbi:hypothetical protein HPB47_016247 [Ixodes persulcatus]|uniref:Uncharacterized protein n=1 Tax=Ixodes persulcatus TaxID=34615 RepID=A0AC60QRC2_IXOPE|nr:hypothetical protein HPB47_016247 [Ixodes persulcatus]
MTLRSQRADGRGISAECQQPADAGECMLLHYRFYYDPASDSCKEFVYGGCGGNENNFFNLGQCVKKCNAKPPVYIPG